jgi:SWI/SNF-related matrix-associated actin-dependent regulator 1 of chromatin subfamily A
MQAVETPQGYDLVFDYNRKIIDQIKKSIPGAFWHGVKKVWVAPRSSKREVEALVSKYTVHDNIPEYIGAIPELPELTIDIPLKRTLFPFQAKGVAYSLQNKRVIIGDQPGLGKTTQAVATIVGATAFPCLIICPSSLKINWEREWMTVAGVKAVVMKDSIKDTWPTYYRVAGIQVFIVNYESLKKYFVKSINKKKDEPLRLKHIEFKDAIKLFKSVIIDEIHKCKDGTTQQSKFTMGIAKDKEYRLGLTGTPVVNKPKDLISQLHIIGRLEDFGGYKTFLQRYCGDTGSGSSNLHELSYKLSTTCFFQRQKKEVLKELPDKMRQIVLCDITTRKEYQAAVDNLASYLKQYRDKTDPEVQKSMMGQAMVLMGICKNISARGKLDDVIEHIDEVIGSGEKIGIFIHQKEIANALRAHYPNAVSITGDDSMDSRQRAVDSFQNDSSCKLIILSIKAAGVGLTLTASSRMAFVELPWHAADTDQCEDRFHRIGQKDSVQCTYFLGKDTIDEYIYEIIESKREIANTITGSADNVQRQVVDKLMDSLFRKESINS